MIICCAYVECRYSKNMCYRICTWKSHQSFANVDKKMKIWDQIEGTSAAASKGSIVWKSVFLQFWNSSCTTQNLEEGSMNTILAHCSRKYHHHSCHDATQAIFDLSLNRKITRIIFRFNLTIQRVPALCGFWDLTKTKLCEISVSGTVLKTQHNAKFPPLRVNKLKPRKWGPHKWFSGIWGTPCST